jgi:hypothetical protein
MIADKAWGLMHVVLFHRFLAMKSLASAWKESQAVAFLLSPLGGELYHYAVTMSVVYFTNCFNIALHTLFRFQQLSQSKVRWLDSSSCNTPWSYDSTSTTRLQLSHYQHYPNTQNPRPLPTTSRLEVGCCITPTAPPSSAPNLPCHPFPGQQRT